MKSFRLVLLLLLHIQCSSFAGGRFSDCSPGMNENDEGNSSIVLMPIVANSGLGPGFGLSYEQFLGAKRSLRLVVPVAVLFQNPDVDKVYPYTASKQYRVAYLKYFSFSPGIDFTVTDPEKRVSYGFGPNLLFAFSDAKLEQLDQFDVNGVLRGFYNNIRKKTLRMGILLNNYLQMQMGRHFCFNISVGFGFWAYDRERIFSLKDESVLMDQRYPPEATLQATAGIGYRF